MYQIKFTDTKKVLRSIFILLLFIIFPIFGCGSGGGGSSDYSSGDNSESGTSINSATLTWDPPATSADGTPLTDLAGYTIYYGTSSLNYTVSIDVGNVTTYKIDNLSPGTYYFSVTAYDTAGNESDFSNEVSKTIW